MKTEIKGMRNRRKRSENIAGYLFLLPSLIGFFGFILFPIVASLLLSFTKWSYALGISGVQWRGLSNFISLTHDYQFIAAVKNTLWYTLYTVPVAIVLGFIVSVLIHDFAYGKTLLKIVIFLPYVSSLVAVSIVWKMILNPTQGPINQFLLSIGVKNVPGWLGSSKWALIAIALVTVWVQIGYNVILYMAAFTNIDNGLYDAAKIDGCNAFQRVRYITLPGVRSTTFFLTITALINSFKVFDQVSVMTQGGPGDSTLVLAYYIYQKAFTYYDMGYACAVALVMFLMVLAITAVQWKFGGKLEEE